MYMNIVFHIQKTNKRVRVYVLQVIQLNTCKIKIPNIPIDKNKEKESKILAKIFQKKNYLSTKYFTSVNYAKIYLKIEYTSYLFRNKKKICWTSNKRNEVCIWTLQIKISNPKEAQ